MPKYKVFISSDVVPNIYVEAEDFRVGPDSVVFTNGTGSDQKTALYVERNRLLGFSAVPGSETK